MTYMPLINNITLLIALSILHGLVIRRWRKGTLAYSVSTGILFGIVCIVGIKSAFVLRPGLIFDGRSIIISIASFLGGPVTAIITVLISGAYRVSIGGSGMLMGLGVITSSALIGLIYFYIEKRCPGCKSAFHLLLLGLLVHVVMLAMMFLLPGGLSGEAFAIVGIPVMVIYPLATMVLGLFFVGQEARTLSDIKLEESERKYRELAESTNIVILRWDITTHTITYMNEYGLRLFGFEPDELLGKPLIGTIVPETDTSGQDLTGLVQEVINRPEHYINLENENIRKDGSRLWMRWRNQALKNDAGEVIEFLTVGIDITRRRQVEQRNVQLGEIIESSLDEIYVFDTETLKFVEVNLGALENLGYTLEELTGMTPLDIKPAYTEASFREMIRPLRDGEINRLSFETEHRRKDGTDYPVEVRLQKSMYEDRDVYLAVILDITGRKYSEMALKKSEDNLRRRNTFIETILDNMPIGLAVHDTKTWEALYMNKKFEEIYGWPRTNLDTMEHFFESVYPDPVYRQEIFSRVTADIESGDPKRMVWNDIKIVTKEGYEKYVDARNIPLPEQNQMISTVQDITLGKLADDKLRQQSELLQSILDNIPIMVIVTGKDGSFRWINKTFENVLGFSNAEVQDINFLSVCYPDPEYREEVLEFIMKAEGVWRDFITRTKYGENLSTQWVNLKTTDDTFISIGIDITQQVRTEKQRKDLERQLYQSKKMEAIGRLAGGIAHDFNNMLVVILGNAQLSMTRIRPDSDVYHDIHEIVKAAERSSTLTRQLLAFSRRQIVSPMALNINKVIKEQSSIISRLIGEDIEIVHHLAENLWNIRIDPSQIDQILMNLSANARDAITGPGTITIETKNTLVDQQYSEHNFEAEPGDYVQLSFSDSGCGMSKEVRDHIFEPFFTTKEYQVGTGLGLATVYGIVSQNDGFINVYSEPGNGTTFRIYLPRYEGEAEDITFTGESDLAGGDETILVVEDEEQILVLTRNILEKYGYTVLQTASAEEAVRIVEQHEGDIHLLLTDVVMPTMNGKQLQQKVKVLNPAIKTIFMSGYTDNVIAHRGVLDKGENFIQKPFPLNALVRMVRDVLDG